MHAKQDEIDMCFEGGFFQPGAFECIPTVVHFRECIAVLVICYDQSWVLLP